MQNRVMWQEILSGLASSPQRPNVCRNRSATPMLSLRSGDGTRLMVLPTVVVNRSGEEGEVSPINNSESLEQTESTIETLLIESNLGSQPGGRSGRL